MAFVGQTCFFQECDLAFLVDEWDIMHQNIIIYYIIYKIFVSLSSRRNLTSAAHSFPKLVALPAPPPRCRRNAQQKHDTRVTCGGWLLQSITFVFVVAWHPV